MQNTFNPQIADIDDYVAYLSVAWDVNQDYVRLTLDEQQRFPKYSFYNNGDLKDQEEADRNEWLNDRYEDQLERDENSYGGVSQW